MVSELKQWLTLTLGKERAQVPSDALDLLIKINGPSAAELAHNVFSKVGVYTNTELVDMLLGELIDNSIDTLLKFDVYIDRQSVSLESQRTLNAVMDTLCNVDAYELPHSLVIACESATTADEQLAEVVEMYCGEPTYSVLSILREVRPALVEKIKELAQEKISDVSDESTTEDGLTVKVKERLAAFCGLVTNKESDVYQYMATGNKLGLPFVSYLAYFITQLNAASRDKQLVAEQLVLLALYSNAEDVMGAISPYLEKIYPDINEVIEVTRHLKLLIAKMG